MLKNIVLAKCVLLSPMRLKALSEYLPQILKTVSKLRVKNEFTFGNVFLNHKIIEYIFKIMKETIIKKI